MNHTKWLYLFSLHWRVERNWMSLNFNVMHLKHSLLPQICQSKSMQSVSFYWWLLMIDEAMIGLFVCPGSKPFLCDRRHWKKSRPQTKHFTYWLTLPWPSSTVIAFHFLLWFQMQVKLVHYWFGQCAVRVRHSSLHVERLLYQIWAFLWQRQGVCHF